MGERVKVFISYSHDTPEHEKRVLVLSERLLEDLKGFIEISLDQNVNGTPEQKWPRWMLDQRDWADYVLCVCTETYYRRFRGLEVSDKGKGVDWEGDIIVQEIYRQKNRTKKFVPVMFHQSDKPFIPDPLQGHTFYVLNTDSEYRKLYDFLLDQGSEEEGSKKTEDVQPTKSENENPSDPYSTLNDDLRIKEIVRSKIQLILNKDLLKEVRESLCGDLCKTIDDTAAKRIAEILVDLPVLDAVIKLEDAVRAFFDPADMPQKKRENIFSQWQLCLDILGWLLLLTVNPEWRNKHRSVFSNESSLNFKLSVTNKSAADIAVAGVAETPADVTRSGIKRLYGCCDIGVELGIFPSDTARAIAKCIYRALFSREPDVGKDDYLKEINADLLTYAKRNRLRYLTIDSNHRDHQLNDEATLNELKRLLPNLSIVHIGVQGNGVDVFLIPELHVLANIRRFLEIGAQLKGV